jgi:putative endonuclease
MTRVTADGDVFEARACEFLSAAGLTLITRNWRCRLGEIDLIMREGATLVFVEVRKRSALQFGGAGASISATKLKKLEAAAALYLADFPRAPDCRIDAVVFDVRVGAQDNVRPEWIKNISQH